MPWAIVAVVAAMILATVPLLWNPTFYWADDTVNGAFGQWYHLGSELRSGRIPMLEPSVWSSGNLYAEGQWGFFNPLVWLISVGSTFFGDAAVYVTIVKVAVVGIGAAGSYALGRDLGAAPQFAFLAAITAPFSGITAYFDAPSWVTGLIVWALVPWAWYFLRRASRGEANPFPAFASSFLVVSIGYVHGTIALVFVYLSVLVQIIVRKNTRGLVNILILGVLAALVAVAVHLPSLLTSAVTLRSDRGVFMDQYMSLDLSGLAMSAVPTALPQVTSWWWVGLTAVVPMAYIAWTLPLFAFATRTGLALIRRRGLDVALAGVLFLAFTLLPTVVGPLRYPARMMPYVALAVILLLSVALTGRRRTPISRGRLAVALTLVASGTFVTWAQTPDLWQRHAAAAVVSALAVLAFWFVQNRQGRPRLAAEGPLRGAIALGVLFLTVTLAFSALQHSRYPSSPWAPQNVPSSVDALQSALPGGVGDVIVVGNPRDNPMDASLWNETLQANLWYVNGNEVVNRYQILGFRHYNDDLCIGYLGETCAELLPRLFTEDPETGAQLVDLLHLDTIQIIKASVPEDLRAVVPPGWHVSEDEAHTVSWVRDAPIGRAGGIAWSSPGADVDVVRRSKETVVLRLNHASAGDKVVFSRLAWPGYSTSAGSFADPLRGYLLSVDLPATDEPVELVVSFRPPGWWVGIAALTSALLAAVVWSLFALIRRRRTASVVLQPDAPDPGARGIVEPRPESSR